MQVGSLVEEFEVVRLGEVAFHHVNEAIVVLDGAARILHEQRAGLPESAADLGAEVWVPLAGETGREIYDGEIHWSVGDGGRVKRFTAIVTTEIASLYSFFQREGERNLLNNFTKHHYVKVFSYE